MFSKFTGIVLCFFSLSVSMPLSIQASTTDHRGSKLEQAMRSVESHKDWMIGANSKGNVKAITAAAPKKNVLYNLKSLYKKKFFQYEKQGFINGINLGWTKNASAKTAEKRAYWGFFPAVKGAGSRITYGTRDQPIRYGERIALAWVTPKAKKKSKKKFMRYSKRKTGVNLDWSKKPVYEWTVLGGKPGTRVRLGQDKVILFNLRIKQPLIYFKRKRGGHIGWPNSTRATLGGVVIDINAPETRKKIYNTTWSELMMDDARDMLINGR